MAKRTLQQINGDIAAGNVELIFYRAGWASDRVLSDYGEDLVVQPIQPIAGAVGGTVDHFRLLVQVKGTQSRPKPNGDWHVPVGKPQIARWIRMAEQVVLAAWHIRKKECRFLVPSDKFSISDFPLGSEGKQQVVFAPSQTLDDAALKELAWRFRIRNLARDMLVQNNQIEEIDSRLKLIRPLRIRTRNSGGRGIFNDYHADERAELEPVRARLDGLRKRLADEFLMQLGIFDQEGMCTEVQDDWLPFYEGTPYEAYETDEGDYDPRFYYGMTEVRAAAKELWGGYVDKVVLDACAWRFIDLLPEDPTKVADE